MVDNPVDSSDPRKETEAMKRIFRISAVVGLLALAAPAAASAATTAPAGTCGTGSPVFANWNDRSNYQLAVNGDLEAGGLGWTMTGGAAVVSGGDPFALGGKVSTKALALPAGSSATTASSCIAEGMPTFRLLARNQGAATAKLRVEAVYGFGAFKVSKVVGDFTAGSVWAPARQLSLALGLVGDATNVQFRFTPLDATGRWQIDSVYIDPMMRR
jgi:hypothetical protein